MEEKALKPLGENASLDANETRARMGIFHMALISSWSLDWKCLLVGSWLDVHRSCCLLLVAFLESSQSYHRIIVHRTYHFDLRTCQKGAQRRTIPPIKESKNQFITTRTQND